MYLRKGYSKAVPSRVSYRQHTSRIAVELFKISSTLSKRNYNKQCLWYFLYWHWQIPYKHGACCNTTAGNVNSAIMMHLAIYVIPQNEMHRGNCQQSIIQVRDIFSLQKFYNFIMYACQFTDSSCIPTEDFKCGICLQEFLNPHPACTGGEGGAWGV